MKCFPSHRISSMRTIITTWRADIMVFRLQHRLTYSKNDRKTLTRFCSHSAIRTGPPRVVLWTGRCEATTLGDSRLSTIKELQSHSSNFSKTMIELYPKLRSQTPSLASITQSLWQQDRLTRSCGRQDHVHSSLSSFWTSRSSTCEAVRQWRSALQTSQSMHLWSPKWPQRKEAQRKSLTRLAKKRT